MSSAYSTIRVLCLVPGVAVARNASVGSASTDSRQSSAANFICSSVQLPIPFTVVNVATAKIGNARVDLQGPRGFSAPYGSNVCHLSGSRKPNADHRLIRPQIDL
jgi:hypothetical protein